MTGRDRYWEMIERSIDVDLWFGGPLLVVEPVPATACDRCGENIFTPAMTKNPELFGHDGSPIDLPRCERSSYPGFRS